MNPRNTKIALGVAALIVLLVLLRFMDFRSTLDPEFDLTGQPITITPQVHETRQALRLAYNDWVGPDNEVQDGDELLGWATWDLEEGTCTIHIDRQLISGPIRKFEEIIGHEYLHCLYGRYHD